MVGVADEHIVYSRVVPMEYFRHNTEVAFSTKKYLHAYADLALELLKVFNAKPRTHRIEICTGYINGLLKDKLRQIGYEVKVVEIKGLLQDELETRYKEYIKEILGWDMYYDPKEMATKSICQEYYKAVDFGIKHRPDLLKTGWDALSKYR